MAALDGLRGVAILLVLLCHSHVPGFYFAGAHGVDLFFVLSGYLITDALGRTDLRTFYLRRAARILPPLLPVVAVGCVLAGSVVAAPWVLGFAANFGRLQGVPMSTLGHFWSLAIEEQFYLLWPAALLLLRRRAALVGVLAVAALNWRMTSFDGTNLGDVYWRPDTNACFLLVGGWIALAKPRVPTGVGWGAVVALVAVTVALDDAAAPTVHAVWSLVVALLCGLAVAGSRGSSPVLEVRWLRRLGVISYGVYLWHGVLVNLGEPTWVRLLLCAVGVVIAVASWRWVEQPAMRWASRRAGVRGVQRADEQPGDGDELLGQAPILAPAGLRVGRP